VHPLLVEFFRANPRGVYDETSSNPSNTSSSIPHAVVLVSSPCDVFVMKSCHSQSLVQQLHMFITAIVLEAIV
jgi:hypothetical protein